MNTYTGTETRKLIATMDVAFDEPTAAFAMTCVMPYRRSEQSASAMDESAMGISETAPAIRMNY
jgi:hypothetical protein